MKLESLVQDGRPDWERLSELVGRGGRLASGRLSADDVAELARLYRRTAADLAKARALDAPSDLTRYLNDLVARGHSYIYRSPPTSWRSIRLFLSGGFPRLFRRRWPYVAVATGVFLLSALGAFIGVVLDSTVAYSLLPEGVIQFIDRDPIGDHDPNWPETLRPILSSVVMTNNMGVSFKAFAFGILFGVGTVYVLALNGVLLGALAARFGLHAQGVIFWSLILPHGILELLAIFIACGSGLLLGHVLLCPGDLSRRGALLRCAPEALQLLLGALPFLAVAAAIEGFVTPSSLPPAFKIPLGVLVGVAALGYLMLGGRR